MASSAKQFSLFLLITLLSSLHTHARDNQFFNKIPNNQQQEQEQEPNFIPETENTYGLYSHESGQLPPSSATTTTSTSAAATTPSAGKPLNKHLPKNYNPVAYVTEPDDINDTSEFTEEKSYATNPTNYYNAASQNYYNTQQEEQVEEPEYRNYPSTTTPNNRNTNNGKSYYMGGGSSFNSQPQGLSDTRLRGGTAFNNGGNFRPQGMSDTRFLENGKYFYDVNSEKYSNNHPYEILKGVQSTDQYSNSKNYYYYYGNRGNVNNEFNNAENYNMGDNGYQNQDEFRGEENYNMP